LTSFRGECDEHSVCQGFTGMISFAGAGRESPLARPAVLCAEGRHQQAVS